MCGIAGMLASRPGENGQMDATLSAMQRALRHRGPDDIGRWKQSRGLAWFAHTRLSVIDVSDAGHQPMTSAESGCSIVFNGEIYNYRELRSSLEAEGIRFFSNSDTEVILRLYERHGEKCLPLLRGMFAFAIWDEHKQCGFLARDRFGIKPLFVMEFPGGLAFASELRSLLASGLASRELDAQAVSRFFETGTVPEPLTMVKGVHMLEAGCCAIWTDGKLRKHRWWEIDFSNAKEGLSPVEATAITRAALEDSIGHHFVSDVPVGLFLSAGIDSTAVLALAKSAGYQGMRTFTIGIDDTATDESGMARRTAEHFGAQHAELHLEARAGGELFRTFLNSIDQPTIDGFNTYSVAKLAREHGIKVALSGLGGDELFGGYPSFIKLPQLASFSRALGPLKGLAGSILNRMKSRPPAIRLGSALQHGGSLDLLYDSFRGVYSRTHARLLAEHFTGQSLSAKELSHEGAQHTFPTKEDEISFHELSRYMRNQLLRDSDVMSMAHGLELRVPLVDSGLFDAVSVIPASLRLRQGKGLLLDAVPEIPDWIRNRPKGGFLFPYEKWLATPDWRNLFEAELKDMPIPPANWYQRWSVFVFKRWRAAAGL
jgi:asparagine synthase (glutamine-hydrolysing)